MGHSRIHQSQLRKPSSSSASPTHSLRSGPRTRSDEDEREGDEEARQHGERGQALPGHAPGLLTVVDPVEPADQRVHGAARRPEREQEADDDERDAAALVLGHAREAVLDQRQRLGGDDALEAVEHRLDRLRPGGLGEDSDGDEEHRRDGEEGVVGERRGDVGDVVVQRLAPAADHDRAPVAEGEVAQARVVDARLRPLGLRRGRARGEIAAGGHRISAYPGAMVVSPAGVAELADATGLGPVGRKPLEVRVLSPASSKYHRSRAGARVSGRWGRGRSVAA